MDGPASKLDLQRIETRLTIAVLGMVCWTALLAVALLS